MAATWQGLIESALDELGVRGRPGTATAVADEEIGVGFERLRQMLDAWNLDDLLRVGLERASLTLGSSVSVLTIGVGEGNDFRFAPPEKVDGILYRVVGESYTYRLSRDSVFDIARWSFDGGTRPSLYYYENSFPVGRLTFNGSFVVGDWVELIYPTSLPDLSYDDDAGRVRLLAMEPVLPRGYERAIICNLAIELSAVYGESVSPVTVENAAEGLEMIRSRNVDVPLTDFGEYARASGGNRGGLFTRYCGGWR